MKKQNTIFTFTFLLLTIFSVSSVCSVAEIQLASAKPFGEDGSIKNNKLCKTNPIPQHPKMIINAVMTMTNNKKQQTTNFEKQTQTKPIQSQIKPNQSQFKPNQTQSNPKQSQNKPNFIHRSRSAGNHQYLS
jgi:hypothetical protein